MYLKEMGYEAVDWIHMAQDRVQWRILVSTVMYLWVPKKCREILDQLSDYELLKKDSVP
jgi:hypothetical protein